jgi:hypothetical protein
MPVVLDRSLVCSCRACSGDKPKACPNNDGSRYYCCAAGQKCRENCDLNTMTTCCCTEDSYEIVEVFDFKYGQPSEVEDPFRARLVSIGDASNYGASPQPIGAITAEFITEQTSTLTWSAGLKLTASAKVKTGFPYFGEGELTLGTEVSGGYSDARTESYKTSVKFDTGSTIVPAYSYTTVEFQGESTTYKIPFTATGREVNQCGQTRDAQVSGSAYVKGVAAVSQAKYAKLIGPTVPVECKRPTGSVDEQNWYNDAYGYCDGSEPICYSHALCKRIGLWSSIESCCSPGSMKPCCAQAEAHPACSGYAPTDVLCPSRTGAFAACCNTQAGRLLSEAATNTSTSNFTVEVRSFVEYLTPEQAAALLASSGKPAKAASSASTAEACAPLSTTRRVDAYPAGENCAGNAAQAPGPGSGAADPTPTTIAAAVAAASFVGICAAIIYRKRRGGAHHPDAAAVPHKLSI